MSWDDVGAYLAALDARREDVTRQYGAMTDSQRRRLLLVEYHCAARGCLLLRVWASTHGAAFYRPAYILTAERNLATSNEAGRAANTTDGFNRWKDGCDVWPSAFANDPGAAWSLNCRHVAATVPMSDIDRDITGATPGKPARRSVLSVSDADLRTVPLSSVTKS